MKEEFKILKFFYLCLCILIALFIIYVYFFERKEEFLTNLQVVDETIYCHNHNMKALYHQDPATLNIKQVICITDE